MAAESGHSNIALYSAEQYKICEVLHVHQVKKSNCEAALSYLNKGKKCYGILKVKGNCTCVHNAVLSKPPMSQMVLMFVIDKNISVIVFMDSSSFSTREKSCILNVYYY